MNLMFDDWIFDIDKEKNISFYKTNESCECLPCQNFAKSVSSIFPELNKFLSQLGVNIQHPEETIWMEEDIAKQTVYYEVVYTVHGSILKTGNYEIDIDNINISISPSVDSTINTVMSEPYFVLSIFNIVLPWEMDENFFDVFFTDNSKNNPADQNMRKYKNTNGTVKSKSRSLFGFYIKILDDFGSLVTVKVGDVLYHKILIGSKISVGHIGKRLINISYIN